MKAPHRERQYAAPPPTAATGSKRKRPRKTKTGRFETLVSLYYPSVHSFASRLTDDPVEAVLLTHSAFNRTRKQLRNRRNEVKIVTILLNAVMQAKHMARLHAANRQKANRPT
jgi:hypothetical protein